MSEQATSFSGSRAPWTPSQSLVLRNATQLSAGSIDFGFPKISGAVSRIQDEIDLAAKMVEMGFAIDLPEYPDADYLHLEKPASRKKLSWRPKKS